MAKRGRKPKQKASYFESEEEQAVIDFINEEDIKKKNEIYNSKLMPAFHKMIESIIRRYKLYIPDEEFSTTFYDTLSYLMTKIHNFKPNNGTKAYSYCGTICKNYLIFKNMQYTKNITRSIPYDMISGGISNNPNYTEDEDNEQSYESASKLLVKISEEIKKMIDSPEEYELSKDEVTVGKAIIELLNNWEKITTANEEDENQNSNGQYKQISNKLHKSAVLYFLREETMMTTKEVRDNMKKFKLAYNAIKEASQEE